MVMQNLFEVVYVNPIALRMAKTLWSFGHSECSRVREDLHERVATHTFSFAIFSSGNQSLEKRICFIRYKFFPVRANHILGAGFLLQRGFI